MVKVLVLEDGRIIDDEHEIIQEIFQSCLLYARDP